MKLFELNFAQMLIRYYLMMMVIIIAGFTGQWWLTGLGFLFFLSAIMGAKFSKNKEQRPEARTIQMGQQASEIRKAS